MGDRTFFSFALCLFSSNLYSMFTYAFHIHGSVVLFAESNESNAYRTRHRKSAVHINFIAIRFIRIQVKFDCNLGVCLLTFPRNMMTKSNDNNKKIHPFLAFRITFFFASKVINVKSFDSCSQCHLRKVVD